MLATVKFRHRHTVDGGCLGARSHKQSRTITASLYCTLWGTVSHCTSSCISRDRPRSYFWVQTCCSNRHTELSDCNLSVTLFAAAANTELQHQPSTWQQLEPLSQLIHSHSFSHSFVLFAQWNGPQMQRSCFVVSNRWVFSLFLNTACEMSGTRSSTGSR